MVDSNMERLRLWPMEQWHEFYNPKCRPVTGLEPRVRQFEQLQCRRMSRAIATNATQVWRLRVYMTYNSLQIFIFSQRSHEQTLQRFSMRLGRLSGIFVPFLLFLLMAMPVLLGAAQTTQSSWQAVGQIGGPTQAVAVQGNYAYVGVGLRLVVLDVSNPAAPREVGAATPFPHFVEDVAIGGTLAYVAAGGGGLRVVDISDPTHPKEVGYWTSPGYAEGVAVAGSVVYLADGPYGLRVIDVSNPAQPKEVGSAFPVNYAFKVAVNGHYVYVAAAGAGLLIADVTDPNHPVEVGSLDTPGYAYGVAVGGNTVYVADGWQGVRVINVSDASHPVEIGSYKTPGWAFGVAISGNLAYVADAFKGLRVLDVSDPSHPKELGSYEAEGCHAGTVVVQGNTAYVADRNWGLRTIGKPGTLA
jgi:hypothetical protein